MKVLGITGDVTTCECCGRKNLKKTIVLRTDAGEVYYGTQCATLALDGNKRASTVKGLTLQATALSQARLWLAAGIDPVVIGIAISARYGYQSGVCQGKLRIADHEIDLS